ncbi:MAG: cyclase family protein [Candidatus Hydrogenedentes bacterium]|nr:cyclase family protein [Candidatus Hydrogenedentota bacterium]
MAIRWTDVTIPMRDGMTVWPGDPAFVFSPLSRIAEGASCNVSALAMSTHTGTHVDAPWHFEDNGARLDQVDTSIFFGEALLLDVPHADLIREEHLGEAPLPPRVLIKTRNSEYPPNAPFQKDYVALAPDAAQRLVDDRVRLVGVDYLSVAPFKQPGQDTHHILLRNNVFVVEGLVLSPFVTRTYQFVVLPLPLIGADGSPCRAFIGEEEVDGP